MNSKINFPIMLIGAQNNLEIITDVKQITHITSKSLKEKTLLYAIIFDYSGNVFKITDVKKINNFNPWWKFEFYNPVVTVELITENQTVPFSDIKDRVISAIKSHPDFWESCPFQEVIDTIFKSSSMSEIISFLKKIRGIHSYS